jgi:serine/threonine protein kinase
MIVTQKYRLEHIRAIIGMIPNEDLHIEKVFGHDYFSCVAVAKNNKLAGRLEDIKILESFEPNSREQFLKEGKVLSAMRHANIPEVYDILVTEEMLLFRSEHIEGYSLKEVLEVLKEKNITFPTHAASSIILKIMEALNYAHNGVRLDGRRKSIIHCDIKPSNIILSAAGYKRRKKVDGRFINLLRQGKVEPYLIDFGIAKFAGEAKKGEGTINYMSPEQVQNNASSWRTDIHQLLLVYYEILANKKPYADLRRQKVLDLKSGTDFRIGARERISKQARWMIEKGTARDPAGSFRSEKECLKIFSRLASGEKLAAVIEGYKRPILFIGLMIIIISLSFSAYHIWDYQVLSTDSIIKRIESRADPAVAELEGAAASIRARAFEKKYYEPLISGKFRDKATGKPLYPSYLDSKGEWVLVDANDESAGFFAGLLFFYSDEYPELLKYAKEYAEPVLISEFDGTSPRRFQNALIPGYEKTGDVRYLNKLVNVTDILITHFIERNGMTQCADMYVEPLFMFAYEQTGDKKYFDAYAAYFDEFVSNNIAEDGYIYEFSAVNATSPYGPVPDDKGGRLVSVIDTQQIGNFYLLSGTNEKRFKEITSPFSADFVEVLQALDDMYRITNKTIFKDAFERSLDYYLAKMDSHKIDYLFVSSLNGKENIPTETLSTVKIIRLLKNEKKEIYLNKMKALLSSRYFRAEGEKGILKGNVLFEGMGYVYSDESRKDQTMLEADALFLETK